MHNRVKFFVFWILSSMIPFFLLGGIELGLRLSGYESDKQSLFIEAPNSPDYLIANASFIERYFPAFVPQIAPNAFLKNKQPNTFRVFVFGGSSAEGFPYNFYNGFAEQLEQKLLLNTQGLNIEVVNLGMTAVNSFVIRDLAKRVLPYEPDAILIYAGHNEYYGSFGVATTQYGFTDSVTLKRLILWLKNLRIYQVLEHLLIWEKEDVGLNSLRTTKSDSSEQRTMMAKVIRETNIPMDGEVFSWGIHQFESNLLDIVSIFKDKGIPIYIGTIGSNLKDQAPLSDNSLAIETYQNGQIEFKSGQIDRALQQFQEAKDIDGIRFRAPSAINNVIKEISISDGIMLVDIQQILRTQSISGIEDNSLFIDHLHPNDRGHKLIASSFFDALSTHPRIDASLVPNPVPTPQSISTFEKAYSTVRIARLLVGYPFQKNRSLEEELNEFESIFQSYINKSYIDSIGAVASKEQVFVPEALSRVVAMARLKGDTLEAITHSYELLKWQLRAVNLIESTLDYTFKSGNQNDYLINMLHQIINDGNKDPRYYDLLSSLYLLNEQMDQSNYWLGETEKIAPNSPRLLYNYSRYYLLEGDTLRSREYYRRFLEIQNAQQ